MLWWRIYLFKKMVFATVFVTQRFDRYATQLAYEVSLSLASRMFPNIVFLVFYEASQDSYTRATCDIWSVGGRNTKNVKHYCVATCRLTTEGDYRSKTSVYLNRTGVLEDLTDQRQQQTGISGIDVQDPWVLLGTLLWSMSMEVVIMIYDLHHEKENVTDLDKNAAVSRFHFFWRMCECANIVLLY